MVGESTVQAGPPAPEDAGGGERIGPIFVALMSATSQVMRRVQKAMRLRLAM